MYAPIITIICAANTNMLSTMLVFADRNQRALCLHCSKFKQYKNAAIDWDRVCVRIHMQCWVHTGVIYCVYHVVPMQPWETRKGNPKCLKSWFCITELSTKNYECKLFYYALLPIHQSVAVASLPWDVHLFVVCSRHNNNIGSIELLLLYMHGELHTCMVNVHHHVISTMQAVLTDKAAVVACHWNLLLTVVYKQLVKGDW